MTRASPLRPGDPLRVAGYRILGRLGAGGQGVVYLAESNGSDDGDPVAIKMLRASPDADSAARFQRESRVLPRVASFCTAQVLRTGLAGAVPYIVSEYIDGPTLQQAVAERGPLRGRELHRLAVGTVTALAAIHRAGVVHRDFKPANVLLSRDGPRVIDFGIARHADADVTGGGPIGTPSYMAPEQLGEDPAGPAADLFAWAGTMVFAATGHPPFGADSIPAILTRILRSEPDLGALDGEVRDVVAECLAKDAAARPMARQVLLRLLGRPAAPSGATGPEELEAGSTFAAQATAPRWRGRRGAVLGVAGLLLAAALAYLVIPMTTKPAPPSPSPAVASAGPPGAATSQVVVPALGVKLYENPSDPLRLTAFIRTGPGLAFTAAWRRPGSGGFQTIDERMLLQVSPDGAGMAAVDQNPQYAHQNVNQVRLTDRTLGHEFWVPTVRPPLAVRGMVWAEDSRRLLLTVYDSRDAKGDSVGFAVVDRRTRTATFSRVNETGTGKGDYVWGPGETVARVPLKKAGGVRLYRLDGTPRQTITGIRVPAGDTPKISSTGRFASLCSDDQHAACVLDATGRRQASFPLPAGGVIWFWFNADHLAVYNGTGKPPRLDVVDLTGKPVRLLAEFTPNTTWLVHFSAG
jgi:predicted Ser/Thr protein kinase